MKILVCISKVPDTTSKIEFTDGNSTFNENGVSFIMNPYDEWYALVKGIELKEEHGGTVTVVHVGPKENETIIRKALAIGADDAIRIDKVPKSSLDVAGQIAAVVDDSYDIVLTGKETIEYNNSEMGSALAEFLQCPFISYAVYLESDGERFKVTREIEGGSEVLTSSHRMVISASKGLAEQRIPNMRGIMMSKRKPINVVQPIETGDVGYQIIEFVKPEGRSSCQYVDPDNMEELVRLLSESAKVI